MSKRKPIRPNGTLIQPYTPTEQKLPTDKPVVQYIRQSSKKQQRKNRVSRDMQDVDMRNNLLTMGWKPELILPAIDDDTTKSGTKRRDERKGLDRLYQLIESGKIGAVAAYNVSRIYRTLSKAELGRFCDLVKDNGLPVVTARRIYWPTEQDNKALLADFQAAGDYIEDHIKGVVIAAKLYHTENDVSYAGNAVPFGYIVTGMGDDTAERKYYVKYQPHADLIVWLFKRFRELGGNVPLLARELRQTNFRFPAFEDGIAYHVGLHADADGTYPLRTRSAITGILTNRAYLGWYVFDGVIISRQAHDAIVPMEDFLYAWNCFNKTSLDGSEEQEPIKRERRYSQGGMRALLDGIVRSGDLPVYVAKERYMSHTNNGGFGNYELVVPVVPVDAAFAKAMIASLAVLERAHQRGLHEDLYARVQALQQEQERQVSDYAETLARIDREIANEEMAQEESKVAGDREGYRKATRQLVLLRKDKAAIEAKANQATSEASELAECHNLIECAVSQWAVWPIHKRKRLVKLLVESANMTEVSPHFTRLDVALIEPVCKSISIFLYRSHGSRLLWTDDEITTLKNRYPIASKQTLMKALPTHSWQAIQDKAYELGVVRTYQPGDKTERATRALCYADHQVIREYGARLDRPVWTIEDSEAMMSHLWGVVPDEANHGGGHFQGEEAPPGP
jgi:DNA invertase Pin-like site-specific DNA recombinase